MSPTARRRRRRFLLLAAFAVCAVIFGILMVQKYAGRKPTGAPVSAPAPGAAFTATLFFASPDGTGLAREAREVERAEEMADDVESVLEELANGPLGELAPTLPPNALFSGVELRGDMAVVDVGNELVDALPAGSHAELLAVYSVVDSICANFPAIRKVQFLVAGKQVETLKGHVDLREPLAADFTLVKK